MKKHGTIFLLLIYPVLCFTQKTIKHTTESPQVLAEKLTAHHQTDLDKTKAIFYWITENISYKVNRYVPNRFFVSYEEEDTGALKPLDERIAINVLRRREAVCDGYARLFKTLCDYAGLQSVVIHGYARTNDGRKSPFRPNHSWNAILLDDKWFLLDVTWASGFIDSRLNTYVARTDEKYFLTSPSQFIADHYPEDIQWTLLADPPVLREYKKSPFVHAAYRKNNLVSFSPSYGILEAVVGDTIHFEIETTGPERLLYVSEFYSSDSTSGSGYPLFAEKEKKTKKIIYSYVIASPLTKWLNVIYNGEQILRYRVKINGAENGSMSVRRK
ncbi:MAG: hypothetical protein H0V30_01800 [Chitinophagaceae bacterium]|jgi:transglutaminase/protease-like cytokinesis protein 3|nr:hypothetical protein [Chitinophagaceae bacterium]